MHTLCVNTRSHHCKYWSHNSMRAMHKQNKTQTSFDTPRRWTSVQKAACPRNTRRITTSLLCTLLLTPLNVRLAAKKALWWKSRKTNLWRNSDFHVQFKKKKIVCLCVLELSVWYLPLTMFMFLKQIVTREASLLSKYIFYEHEISMG